MAIGVGALALVAGCKTIVVQSTPKGANVKSGEVNASSPADVQVNMFGKTPVTVSKPGYAPRTVSIGFSSPTPYTVQLDKLYSVNANVDGATVTVDGTVKGATPAKAVAINENAESIVKVSKPGWLDAKVKVMPDTPADIYLNMDKDGAGRHLLNLIFNQDGISIREELIFSDTDTAENSPSVKSAKRLTDYGDDEFLQNISLLPDGKTLVASLIERYREKGRTNYRANIWRLDTSIAGAPRKHVTDGDFIDITPNASVDGHTLYFASTRGGRAGIWSVNMDSQSGYKMVTAGSTADFLPAIGPDGSQLVYTAINPVGSQPPHLWARAADGSGLPTQFRRGYNAVWSPDGKRVLFVDGSMSEGKARIYVMDANGGNVTQLTSSSDKYNDIDPRWSPDGSKIVFSSNRGVIKGVNNYDIWIMNADGSHPTQLTTNASCDDRPVFAPDGRRIFFRSNRGLNWDIWVLEVNE